MWCHTTSSKCVCVCFFNASIQSWQEWREKDTLLGHWQKSLLNTTFYENRLSFFYLRNKQALFIEHLFCVRHCSRSCKCSSEQNRLSPYLLGADILLKEKRNKHANLQCVGWRGASWRWRAVWWEGAGWFGMWAVAVLSEMLGWGRGLEKVRGEAFRHLGRASQQESSPWGQTVFGEQWGDRCGAAVRWSGGRRQVEGCLRAAADPSFHPYHHHCLCPCFFKRRCRSSHFKKFPILRRK